MKHHKSLGSLCKSGSIMKCIKASESVRKHQEGFTDSWWFLTLFNPSWGFLIRLTASSHFLILLIIFLGLFPFAYAQWHLLTLPDASWLLPSLPDASGHFLILAENSWYFSLRLNMNSGIQFQSILLLPNIFFVYSNSFHIYIRFSYLLSRSPCQAV